METLSKEEFKKRYGTTGLSMLKKANETQNSSYSQRLKQAAGAGLTKIKEASRDINSGNPIKFAEGAIKAGAGAVETAFSPITSAIEPVTKPTIGAAVNYAADKISNNPKVQEFSVSKIGELTSRITEDLNNLNTIASAISVPKAATGVTSTVRQGVVNAVDNIPRPTMPKLNGIAGGVAKDIIPTPKGIISEQISRAFELTPQDVFKISQKHKTDVGEFIADNNLIGKSVDESKGLLTQFKNQNYKQVRDEIAQVKNQYVPTEVPRYTQALEMTKKQIADVPGLEADNALINSLLKKKTFELADTQVAKELLDKHFDVYNVLGDTKSGSIKIGVDEIRGDLRSFIENEVKNNSGVDIYDLNNKVATSSTILRAINQRAGRSATRSAVSLADLGWFGGGSVVGTPLFGAALVFSKKVLESPTVRLRIAKFIKGLDDAKKAKIKTDLQSGVIPVELKKVPGLKIKVKGGDLKPAQVTVKKKLADPLTTEARKYKSAEEFVNTQKQVFRSSKDSFDISKVNSDYGVPVAKNKSTAEIFNRGGRNIEELFIDPKAKVLTELPDKFKVGDNFDTDITAYAKNNGFDVIDLKAERNAGIDELRVVNPDVIKTKSQLTDIWKKANKK